MELYFINKVILDVGAHKGGFTDYVLRAGAQLIVAVDVGQQPLDLKLQKNAKIKSFTGVDIRQFVYPAQLPKPDYILVDLSFISLRKVLPSLAWFCHSQTILLVLLKPQFETEAQSLNRGVVKNQIIRRRIMKEFEDYVQKQGYLILKKN